MENPVFPESRSCNDICWVLFFFLVLAGGLGASVFFGRSINEFGQHSVYTPTSAPTAAYDPALTPFAPAPTPAPVVNQWGQTARLLQPMVGQQQQSQYAFSKNVKPGFLALGTVAGVVVSLAAAVALTIISKFYGKCVVYTSLLFSCALMIAMGVSLIISGTAGTGYPASFNMLFKILGFVMIGMGVCMATCILCCWHSMIEFTARVVSQCGEVTMDNFCMIIVAIVGAFFSAIWSIVVAIALDGVVAKYADDIATCDWCGYAIFGGFFFVWLWGCMVSSSICYTTFCGVFGKWYYSDDEQHHHHYDSPVCESLCVASTYSLGSICFGTFLVAIVRTVQFVVRMAEQQAREDGNIVCMLALCCVRCILDCIGDIIEYFNEWAYVQCAIRGTTFCESAKVVFSLCTVRNIYLIWATLLIDSVVNFGSFLGGACGALLGAGIGYGGSPETALVGALCGFIAGNAAAWCVMSTFSAGAKTLLTCWAENPETLLGKSHETDYLAQMFKEKGNLM